MCWPSTEVALYGKGGRNTIEDEFLTLSAYSASAYSIVSKNLPQDIGSIHLSAWTSTEEMGHDKHQSTKDA